MTGGLDLKEKAISRKTDRECLKRLRHLIVSQESIFIKMDPHSSPVHSLNVVYFVSSFTGTGDTFDCPQNALKLADGQEQ